MNDIVLKCTDVSFSYFTARDELKLFSDVNFEVKRGEVVSISGKSGSGKSTLLHIISSLKKPTAGSVEMFEKDIYTLRKRDVAGLRAERVGFVFQGFNLISELNAYENIILPIRIAKKERGYIDSILALSSRIGVSGVLKSKINQLSGGEKARVAILRALACRPDIVFLDEPTGALDSENARLIEDLIIELSKSLATTFIYVTHDMEFAKRADTRYEIRDKGLIRLQ